MAAVGGRDVAPSILTALSAGSLKWFPEHGCGYYPATPGPNNYGEAYFAKYTEYAETDLGRRLTAARMELVNSHWEGPLVDVGIGCGAFVAARHGTFGYDVNSWAVEWLNRRELWWNPYVRPCKAASMWDVIEHIPDFPALLEQIHDFVFISLPIFDGPDHVLRSKHYRRDEHYWYFTESGFVRLMRGLGWTCLERNDAETKLGREGIASFAFGRMP